MPCKMVVADGELSDGQNVISNVQSAMHDRCRELSRQQVCRNVTVSIKFVASTRWKFFSQKWFSARGGHEVFPRCHELLNLCANCMAWLRASPYITVFSKWKSSSLCHGPSLAIASCSMCSAIVNELVEHGSWQEGWSPTWPPSPLVGDPVRARHSLRFGAAFRALKTVPRKVHPRNLSGS